MEETTFCPKCGSLSLRNGKCFMCGYSTESTSQEDELATQTPQNTPTNLAPCPDCGHMVSLYATSCPNCGRPLKPLKELQTKPVVDEEEEKEMPQGKHNGSGCGTFVAVVLGILVAVWVLSKILHVEITGTITPIIKQ